MRPFVREECSGGKALRERKQLDFVLPVTASSPASRLLQGSRRAADHCRSRLAGDSYLRFSDYFPSFTRVQPRVITR
ncbi:hypothetical protein J2Y74_003261 [Pseudomonas migulae]|nr:hypothetical protein [Pseudomonas migulae]